LKSYMESWSDNFLQLRKPICCICNKEVDSVKVWYDVGFDQFIFIANCHNMEEVKELGKQFFSEHHFSDIGKGYAFQTKCLENSDIKQLDLK